MAKRKQQRRKTARIYYGINSDGDHLYWTVRVKDATHPVEIDGTLLDAIRGTPGSTIGCHLSNCAKQNADQFPHPCKLVAFTKSTAFVVTEIHNGKPSDAVRYSHSYGAMVDINDMMPTKRFIKRHPELAERTFTLRPPRRIRPFTREHTATGETNYNKRPMVPRGAMQRAQAAGLVSPGMANMGFE